MNTFCTLPAVGNGGISLGGTVVGSFSFLIGNTKISTTMRMIKRTNTTAAAVIILHFLELQQNEKKKITLCTRKKVKTVCNVHCYKIHHGKTRAELVMSSAGKQEAGNSGDR